VYAAAPAEDAVELTAVAARGDKVDIAVAVQVAGTKASYIPRTRREMSCRRHGARASPGFSNHAMRRPSRRLLRVGRPHPSTRRNTPGENIQPRIAASDDIRIAVSVDNRRAQCRPPRPAACRRSGNRSRAGPGPKAGGATRGPNICGALPRSRHFRDAHDKVFPPVGIEIRECRLDSSGRTTPVRVDREPGSILMGCACTVTLFAASASTTSSIVNCCCNRSAARMSSRRHRQYRRASPYSARHQEQDLLLPCRLVQRDAVDDEQGRRAIRASASRRVDNVSRALIGATRSRRPS